MTFLSNPLFHFITFFALLQVLTAVTVRSIPSTKVNQDFFSLSQSIINIGTRKISSCGPDLPAIEQCIRVCNSPGLPERGGCCCIARANNFSIGLRGGCRYSQRVQNFTSRFIYKSSPITRGNKFFGETSCKKSVPTGTGGPCTCSIQWEAETDVLEMTSPLPTPSVSASPVLTATPSPVPSKSPAATPEPSVPVDTFEPTGEETVTPTPDNELIPTGPGPKPSEDDTDGADEPTGSDDVDDDDDDDDGDRDVDGIIMFDPSPSPEVESSPDEAEQQAEDDDGSVCVDERYLKERGFDSDSLVHKEGIMANVLCPQATSLPCGTADHKVRVGGQDMSYEYMCSRLDVQCRAARMKVNSVYSHLWTDVAHEDVMLTMFDVRYGETAQKALHAVMRGWRSAKKRIFA